MEEVATVASELGALLRRGVLRRGSGIWRLGQKEHAVELSGDGEGGAAHGIVQQSEVIGGDREAQQLIVVIDG